MNSLKRQCGGCTLCCKLLPVKSLNKAAGTRCQHQRTGKGCAIYTKRPLDCRVWNCIWLVDSDNDMKRPDRSHYVIDTMPDFVTLHDQTTDTHTKMPVIQVWVDPNHRHAHRDPALRAYLDKRGQAVLVRWSENEAIALFPPSTSADGQWHEVNSTVAEHEHTMTEIINEIRKDTHYERPDVAVLPIRTLEARASAHFETVWHDRPVDGQRSAYES